MARLRLCDDVRTILIHRIFEISTKQKFHACLSNNFRKSLPISD